LVVTLLVQKSTEVQVHLFFYLAAAADDRCAWLVSEPYGQVPLFPIISRAMFALQLVVGVLLLSTFLPSSLHVGFLY
jgi:hypothetical protein